MDQPTESRPGGAQATSISLHVSVSPTVRRDEADSYKSCLGRRAHFVQAPGWFMTDSAVTSSRNTISTVRLDWPLRPILRIPIVSAPARGLTVLRLSCLQTRRNHSRIRHRRLLRLW